MLGKLYKLIQKMVYFSFNYCCEWNPVLEVLGRALEGPRYHEIIAVALSEKIRKKRVQPKGFCSTFTTVTKGPLGISLPSWVQEATAGLASQPCPRLCPEEGGEALLPTLPHQKPRLGDPVEGMTKQSFVSDTYKNSLKKKSISRIVKAGRTRLRT